MKRPTGVTVIAIVTVVAAAILTLSCLAFAFIAIMTMTGEGFDAATAAITGMAIGGSVSLIILLIDRFGTPWKIRNVVFMLPLAPVLPRSR
ncbi:MAG: hypothetical protein WCD49_18520 [Candidatus Acidiferrales bacterium]